MPIKVKTDLEFGDVFYLRNDDEQLEHLLVGVILVAGGKPDTVSVKFQLSFLGQVCEVWDYECTKEKNPLKSAGVDEGD